jgi:inorganic pyrophosphatase
MPSELKVAGLGLQPRQRNGLLKQAFVLSAVALAVYMVCLVYTGVHEGQQSVELLSATKAASAKLQASKPATAAKKAMSVKTPTKATKLEGEEEGAAEEGAAEGAAEKGDDGTEVYVKDGPASGVWMTHVVIFGCGAIGIAFAAYLYWSVSQVSLDSDNSDSEDAKLIQASKASDEELKTIYSTIQEGAQAFLWAEYQICFIFIAGFGLLILVLVSHTTDADGESVWKWNIGALTATSFVVGGLTSILSGYIGMMVAVFSNARTTVSAKKAGAEGWTASFNTAFRAGGVMGYSLVALSMMVLYIMALCYREIFSKWDGDTRSVDYKTLFECLAGYGLGGSAIAMFGRVGGGIFTKAADVGADLSGKVIGVGEGKKLDEDSPYNPGVIADNVGDNVGDVAGMGSDLFGSFGEASCAALLIGASSIAIEEAGWSAIFFPLFISAAGIVVCLAISFVATDLMPVKKEEDIETALKIQLFLTSLVMTIVLFPCALAALPKSMDIAGVSGPVTPFVCFICIVAGLWGGCIIGFITEYYTSHSYQPVRDVARSSETGAATNIIYGLALGYQSVIIPVIIIAFIIFVAVKFAGMYGVALAALGMLAILATCLAIDVYGPISDNAGGIAEMCELPSEVRDKTDALDAAGNTTAAIGKGFAIGSAALVSLALFGAFVTRASASMPVGDSLTIRGVNLLSPVVFAFILYGAMVPYWFSALTMRSVGEAANAMVKEIARQWKEIPGLQDAAGLDFHERQAAKEKGEQLAKPDYQQCIAISTAASLREMIAPGLLVILSPILVGTLCGVEAVCGLLAGAIASSVQLAISMSNTGGAWDNSKKYTEKGELNGWMAFRGGGKDMTEEQFLKMAAESSGNKCMDQKHHYGSTGKSEPVPIKDWLADVEKHDPAKYKRLMEGDEGIETTDGRMCIYAGKKSAIHAAAVVGDTVGDPLKDTSGPALNIVMKLMAIISVVFADFFMSINYGNGLLQCGDLSH